MPTAPPPYPTYQAPYPNCDTISPSAPLPYPVTPTGNSSMYPALNEYMGLELTPEVIAANMPEYSATPQNVSFFVAEASKIFF